MRGYSPVLAGWIAATKLFPAYAGVFPHCCRQLVRGFSPRMRGYSHLMSTTLLWLHLFPAYAGVFPITGASEATFPAYAGVFP